ncbi:MAG TPA: pyridoxamine 5'-phosphate oxidase family protein [Thermohalobaculum sp.]|nr:pyridoxamine 5'-phosphate oxidase family protein [Thermohalobaculum sp.]
MLPEDSLDAIADFAWAELTRAAGDSESQFRHAQLATVGAQGWPQSRTIILRHADTDRREVGFHTDRRSTKAAELAANTSVAIVAYDRSRGLQLRLWGQAELHVEDNRADEAWTALYPPLRTPYRAYHAPGLPIEAPKVGDPTEAARNPVNRENGFENFAFIAIRAVRFEWLQLRPTGHRRARFEWKSGWHGHWLAP